MSYFTELEHWKKPIGGIRYQTIKEVCWDVGKKGSGFTVSVPVGYEFDFSVPVSLRWLIDPKDPIYHKAGCLHDYLLHIEEWERVAAAASFSDALKADGVPKAKRLLMTFAVIQWKYI